jgi:hypothetical protein
VPTPAEAPIQTELTAVHEFYLSLAPAIDPDHGLGGKLLLAGALDEGSARLIRAANIAGAASLVASSDSSALRSAMREGVIDFLVTTLDEALRILKNEIRKRQPVAVGVSQSSSAIVKEMKERGVLPDLLPPHSHSADSSELEEFVAHGARHTRHMKLATGRVFVTLSIPAAWTPRIADFEALLLEFIALDDHANRRWLRLSPRYLGQAARRRRSLVCDVKRVSILQSRIADAEAG